jgi:2-dehydropantoate 2-reductase
MIYAAIGKSSPTAVTHFGGGNLTIGTTQTNPQNLVQAEGHLQSIQQLFEKAAIPTTISENMIADLWTKFVINCVFNGISAIGQINYSSMSKLPEIASLMEALLSECLRVAHACDVPLQADKIRTDIAHISSNWPLQKSSTAQDLAKKKKTEIDHLNGFIVREGERFGIPTPINRTLHALVKLVESTF